MSVVSDLDHFIARYDLIPDGERVIVGVSGGPDSLALLHVLARLAPAHGWHIHAAYLHHGLRPEADEEAIFVGEVAAAWGLGCTIERRDVQSIARQPGVSLEEAARQVRYAFLAAVAQRMQAKIVAVGHHADDQVESVLMHLLRGSGLAGLRGMLPATPLNALRLTALPPAERQIPAHLQLVRPWLQTTRQQIEAYCRDNDLQPRHDASNTDTTFFRNRLRHEVIPLLQRINPRLSAVIGRTALALQGDYEALARHRQRLWQELAGVRSHSISFPLPAFRALPVGDQRALLRRAITHLRPDLRNINWQHSEGLISYLQAHARQSSGGPYSLVAGLQAWLISDLLIVAEADALPTVWPQIDRPRTLPLPGRMALGRHWHLQARRLTWAPSEPPPWQQPAPARVWLPLDIPTPLAVRPRRSGDRMNVLGLGGSKAITDLMTELKLPRPARQHWPLLVDGQDRILWLVGQRASELCRLPAHATAAWQICLYPTSIPNPSPSS